MAVLTIVLAADKVTVTITVTVAVASYGRLPTLQIAAPDDTL